MKIYISSPYTLGDVAANVALQLSAAHQIMDLGHTPIVPLLAHFLHMHRQRPYEDWIRIDLDIVPTADVILRLPGESAGAEREIAEARKFNIPVVYGWEELEAFLAHAHPYANDTLVRIAYAIARSAHAGAFRKDGATPYLTHPIAVAEAVAPHGSIAVAAAFLHDVPEDTKVTFLDLLAAGLPQSVVDVVALLTKKAGTSYENYIEAIKADPIARVVKIADIKHNLSGSPSEHKREAYIKALEILES